MKSKNKTLDISSAQIGFLSSATAHRNEGIDLHTLLIPRPNSTFLVKVKGSAMKDLAILNNDLLIVDKSKNAQHNNIVVVYVNGDFLVRQLIIRNNSQYLIARNNSERFAEIEVDENTLIWGVVISVVRQFINNA